jgi:hypothetical protein
MTFSSTGKTARCPALSLPLLGVLPEEDWDLEQTCEQGDNREYDHDDDHDDNDHHDFGTTPSYRELLILMLSALQILELGWVHWYDSPDNSVQQALSFKALVEDVTVFCFASILYKLSLGCHPAVLVVSKGCWLVNVVFAVLLLSALVFQMGWTYYWLDNEFAFLNEAFLFWVIAAVLYQLSTKKSPVTLVPEIWMCVALATALLGQVEIVFSVLMVGAFIMSLAAAGFASIVSR